MLNTDEVEIHLDGGGGVVVTGFPEDAAALLGERSLAEPDAITG